MSEFFQHFSAPSRTPARRPIPSSLMQATVVLTAAAVTLLGIAGCGNNTRPTVTPITGTGPGSQPFAYAFVVSTPSPTAQGIGTVIDYSGDTIAATAPIGPGPLTFTTNSSGDPAWTLNEDGTVSNIPVSTTLQGKQVLYSTLNPIPTSGPFNGLDPVVALYANSFGLFALDVNLNEVDVLTGSPAAFKLDIPVDQTPVTAVGSTNSPRFYTVSQMIPYSAICNTDPSSVTTTGMADGILTSTDTVSSHIPVGACPVYGVSSSDTRRVFVLNRGSDSVSVINSQNDTLDNCACPPTGCVNQDGQTFTCHPSLPLQGASGMAHAGPVYAEYNPATSQLVVSNYDGNSISIIDVSLDVFGNDSATFGTTFTVPVGRNPASVTVLNDGSRAYVANQSDGTVSIVNMISHTVEKTLAVTGSPRTVVSVQDSIYGKVYVASPNSPYITIIRVDQDIIGTTVLVQGNAVDVRADVSSPGIANTNLVSRLPGAGTPCFLPPAAFASAGAPVTIANCQIQDPALLAPASTPTLRR